MGFCKTIDHPRSTTRSGFTLIELLIVIAIIAILTGLLFTNFSGARERARDTRRKADFDTLKKALQTYYIDYGKFPSDGGGTTINGCGGSGTSICNWTSGTTAGSVFQAGSTVYTGVMPGDPLSPTQQYTYCTTGTVEGVSCSTVDYILWTKLENASDQDSKASQSRCGVSSGNVVAKVYMVCNQ
ncbi:hypothetical protein C5B42_05040 [Candidatus Cerribacteria bacterium 'Amazon FNV 2010 28 9']|uniref:Type II secretion system protein GspG C-terminal domain-containing protein n=1 Tax=Candidatus Cerribacteria bacterium 'Amazon FNV 2010 28 9' TaxID=2081795 RepID=A0A317JP48_9BACT|nr:MAG: hypothetical protein C5B42_05040 [Candidatus Cerribacteria bacterium 'Amazon FNV 2010 28 9']